MEHFNNSRKELLKFSKRADLVNNGGIKGTLREAFINEFLIKNLPPIVDYTTGEIIDVNDSKSGQVDIIIQNKTDPRICLYNNYHIALCDSVLATMEVKSRLTTGKPEGQSTLVLALESVKKVKRLKKEIPIEHIFPFADKKHRIPSMIISYFGPSIETFKKALDEYIAYYNYDEQEKKTLLPEIILVLDKGYFLYKDDGWVFNNSESKEKSKGNYKIFNVKEESMIGIFVYLCNLIQSWNSTHRNSNYLQYLV